MDSRKLDYPHPSPPPEYRERGQEARTGFTLIELLVVIGIIVILIGILLPVVASVRKSGYATATRQEISVIAGACQRYYEDYKSYPGPISENDIDGLVTPPAGTPTKITAFALKGPFPLANAMTVTSSENLVLGLSGGLYLTYSTVTPPAQPVVTGWVYDPASVGKGPQVLNTLINSQRQTFAYFSPRPEELAPTDPTNGYQKFSTTPATDSYIPEYLDHIPGNNVNPTGAPAFTFNANFSYGAIIYMRARVGAQGTVKTTANNSPTVQQYTFTQAAPYDFLLQTINTTDFPVGSNPDQAVTYFSNSNIAGQPKGKDAFILISAGNDRIFGTKDDIIYGN